MIAKKVIKDIIDESSKVYQNCWNTLEKMKLSDKQIGNGEEIINFQPHLAKTLFSLENIYTDIAREKRKFIKRKNNLSEEWFINRMRLLSEYQKSINKCMYIGKSLGDSFVWLFYRNDRPLLLEHLRQSEITHLPTGIGAIGEYEIVNSVRFINGRYIIYHGITTILRIGDISLYDINQHKIVDIGELKSYQAEKEFVNVSIYFTKIKSIGSNEGKTEIIREPKLSNLLERNNSGLEKLPPKMKARFERQANKMADSMVKKDRKPEIDSKIVGNFYLEELDQLAEKLKPSEFVFQQAGPGLVFIGYQNKTSLLSTRLLNFHTSNLDTKLDKLAELVTATVREDSKFNFLYTGSLFYDDEGRVISLAGIVPIFWWPISMEFIKKIMFHEVFIFTTYNPAYLISKLEKEKWKIEHNNENGNFYLSMTYNEASLQLENFYYYLNLVRLYGFRENSIVKILTELIDNIDHFPIGCNIEIAFQQYFIGNSKEITLT